MYRDGLGELGLREAEEVGDLLNGRVPAVQAAVHINRVQHRRHGFGGRADAVNGVCGERLAGRHVAHPEAARIHHLAVLDQGERDARDVKFGQHPQAQAIRSPRSALAVICGFELLAWALPPRRPGNVTSASARARTK